MQKGLLNLYIYYIFFICKGLFLNKYKLNSSLLIWCIPISSLSKNKCIICSRDISTPNYFFYWLVITVPQTICAHIWIMIYIDFELVEYNMYLFFIHFFILQTYYHNGPNECLTFVTSTNREFIFPKIHF